MVKGPGNTGFRRIFPKEILQRLKVSYDALDEDEKEIFLDVACFFIGKRRSRAIAVWDGSGWSGLCSWETLLNKCLIEVYYDMLGKECIWMHDHLRDLGLQIAETRSPSRIRYTGQSMHIQPGMPVCGIARWRTRESLYKAYMEMMRISNVWVGLQLLEVEGNELIQECGELSRGLLWLRWSAFRHRNIPQWLPLENIRVLSLSGSEKWESLWEDDHAPLEWRELAIEVDKVNLRSLPRSIGDLKHLKRLVVAPFHWNQMSSLPEEFCRLQSLKHLVLTYCEELSSLPNHFGDLVNLRHIDLRWCSGLNVLPLSFRQLIHLQYLNLTLETDILDNMTNLKVFQFARCQELQVLPHNITSQASLTKLNFNKTRSIRELPASIDQLSELKELLIEGMPLLTRLRFALGNMSNLITLRLVECPELYDMPSLAGLVSLNDLHVEDCSKFVSD